LAPGLIFSLPVLLNGLAGGFASAPLSRRRFIGDPLLSFFGSGEFGPAVQIRLSLLAILTPELIGLLPGQTLPAALVTDLSGLNPQLDLRYGFTAMRSSPPLLALGRPLLGIDAHLLDIVAGLAKNLTGVGPFSRRWTDRRGKKPPWLPLPMRSKSIRGWPRD
jgi:hypothetical protein